MSMTRSGAAWPGRIALGVVLAAGLLRAEEPPRRPAVAAFGAAEPRGSGRITAAALAPDLGAFVTGWEDGTVLLWEAVPGRAPRRWTLFGSAVTGIGFAPAGDRVVAGGAGGEWRRVDLAGDAVFAPPAGDVPDGPPGAIRGVAVSPDGRWVVSAHDSQKSVLRQEGDGAFVRLIDRYPHDMNALAFSAGGDYLVSVGRDGEGRVWETATNWLLRSLKGGHAAAVLSVACEADGAEAVTGGADRAVCRWNLRTAELLFKRELTAPVRAVAVAAGGRVMAAGGEDGRVRAWLQRAEDPVLDTGPGGGAVLALAFSPVEPVLAGVVADGTARLWDWSSVPGAAAEDAGASPPDARTAWLRLAEPDVLVSWPLQRALAAAGDRGVAILRDPFLRRWELEVNRLVDDLGHEQFEVREAATRRLLEFSSEVRPLLETKRARVADPEVQTRLDHVMGSMRGGAPPAGVPQGDVLRRLRVVRILERIGTPAAREVLAAAAAGDPVAAEVRAAKAAIARLDARPPLPPAR
jgi:WD40 repeat protein